MALKRHSRGATLNSAYRKMLKRVTELERSFLAPPDPETENLIKYYLDEIAAVRKRSRKTLGEINRIKRKTQKILDELS